MTATWSSSINIKSCLIEDFPNSLNEKLIRVQQQHYEELYEPEAEGIVSLQEALNDVLISFQSNNPVLSHLRYVWMALILAVVVEPTVKYYQPDNSIPKATINQLTIWLIETLAKILDNKTPFIKAAVEARTDGMVNLQLVTTSKKNASFQVLSEALDVYSSAIKALDSNQSLQALLDILDDCLEGYAIFTGSDGRRELFDWWLLDVVPSSWFLLAPNSIYLINNQAHEKDITYRQMQKLNKISSAMWLIILEAVKDKNTNHLEGNKITYQISTIDLMLPLTR